MNDEADQPVISNPWQVLRQLTQARIALGRSGVSMPTVAQLEFQLAHARARDAVHLALDADALAQTLMQDGYDCITAHSAARDRMHYLQRPDLGRTLNTDSRRHLLQHHQQQQPMQRPYDLALVIADGLSAQAIIQNAVPFLRALQAELAQEGQEGQERQERPTLAPTVIVQQGRVAIGDEIGEIWQARAVLVLIGERPGLSSPDSMGLYLSWGPKVGLTDAQRNCISNIRPAGLNYATAAYKLHSLLSQARQRRLTGVALKDETARDDINPQGNTVDETQHNFLLSSPEHRVQ